MRDGVQREEPDEACEGHLRDSELAISASEVVSVSSRMCREPRSIDLRGDDLDDQPIALRRARADPASRPA